MTRKPGSIVVGVDGSEHGERALRWAVQQALAERRHLTIVHTIHSVSPSFVDAAVVDGKTARSVLDVAGQKVLDDAREQVAWQAPDLEVHTVFELADPRAVLLQYSEDAAMLVVGSRGRGHLRTLLMGSVSVALVRHAQCPVVVVRPDGDGIRNGIVAGVDASAEARPVLEFAYRQASLHALPLTLVDCVWDLQTGTMGAYWVSDNPPDLEDERIALAEAMAGMQEKYPEVHVTTRMARGIPQEALVHAGATSDLIVVGAHQDGRISQAFFGSVSVAVVESAPSPVAVVPLSTSH